MNCESKIYVVDPFSDFCYIMLLKLDSDFEYGLLSLIHTHPSYKLNLITEKDFLGAWGWRIMQKTKLETHVNFIRDLDAQNALIERSVVAEVNLNMNVLKQLKVFARNRLSRCL